MVLYIFVLILLPLKNPLKFCWIFLKKRRYRFLASSPLLREGEYDKENSIKEWFWIPAGACPRK